MQWLLAFYNVITFCLAPMPVQPAVKNYDGRHYDGYVTVSYVWQSVRSLMCIMFILHILNWLTICCRLLWTRCLMT